MVEIIFGGAIYIASLISCYDGDSCKMQFSENVIFLQTQNVRFDGFDTPEIDGKCAVEETKARKARIVTLDYLNKGGKLYTDGRKDKYGRLLVSAPALKRALINAGLAREYHGKKRLGWC